jgi:hypothetical protein
MLDYAAWVQRAREFVERLRSVPGDMRIEIDIAPPISRTELAPLIAASRLPVPECLIRFWTEASRCCKCTYWWKVPPELENQLRILAPPWRQNYFWGGVDFIGVDSFLGDLEYLPDVGACLKDSPKDRRFWENSVPLFHVGNGDTVGLYVRDGSDNPPVASMSHEGYGSSDVFAPSFDDFLVNWERIGYLGFEFLLSFVTKRKAIEPAEFPLEREIVDSLFRGEARPDLSAPLRRMTEEMWSKESDVYRLCEQLKEIRGPLDLRKRILFCSACCRRKWRLFGEASRLGVIVAERFADGLATESERQAIRDKLSSNIYADGSMTSAILSNEATMQRPYRMCCAAIDTLDGMVLAGSNIAQHLDDPEQSEEGDAHADLVRHVWGNPFRAAEPSIPHDARLVEIAQRLYDGLPVAQDLCELLASLGHENLADHFRTPDHPKGCWALDRILGR